MIIVNLNLKGFLKSCKKSLFSGFVKNKLVRTRLTANRPFSSVASRAQTCTEKGRACQGALLTWGGSSAPASWPLSPSFPGQEPGAPGWQEAKEGTGIWAAATIFPGHFLPSHTSSLWLRSCIHSRVTVNHKPVISARSSSSCWKRWAPWAASGAQRAKWLAGGGGGVGGGHPGSPLRRLQLRTDAGAAADWAEIRFPGTGSSAAAGADASPRLADANACCELRKRRLLSMLGSRLLQGLSAGRDPSSWSEKRRMRGAQSVSCSGGTFLNKITSSPSTHGGRGPGGWGVEGERGRRRRKNKEKESKIYRKERTHGTALGKYFDG